MDVGGKLLTNHLKEVSSFFMFNLFFFTQVISYRQLHVLDETYVMNGCKEDCCYVAKDFDCEVGKLENSKALFHETKKNKVAKAKRNEIARDYVLPDFTAIRRQALLVNLVDDTFL